MIFMGYFDELKAYGDKVNDKTAAEKDFLGIQRLIVRIQDDYNKGVILEQEKKALIALALLVRDEMRKVLRQEG